MEERRKYLRADVSFPVECDLLTQNNYFYTVCKDLCLGGIKILSNKFISKDNILKININFIDEVLRLKAKVIWCNRKRVSDRYVIGLEFIELNVSNQKNIQRFLNKVQPS